MGYYYKDTGSLRNMASAEAVLKRRMPKDHGNGYPEAVTDKSTV